VLVIAKHEEALRALGLHTLDGVKTFRGDLIKNHKGRRDIQRLKVEAQNQSLVLFLKRNWRPYKKDGLHSLLTRGVVWSLSRIEWENSLTLQRAGIDVAEPVAFGEECGPLWEKFSFILTATARGEMTVEEFLQARSEPAERQRVFDALARFVRKMHDAGLASPDLFTRHLFLSRGNDPQFCLIDMARLDRKKKLSPTLRARDLAALHVTAPMRFLTTPERLRFLEIYGGMELRPRIEARAQHLLQRKKFSDFSLPG
jgi:tRNA A-37 threonylcarbamoyl transferase component Bud32